MRRHMGVRNIYGRLTALLLSAILCFTSAAAADAWPEETFTDAEGRQYKQVQTEGGGVEVWQLVGIYGNEQEALELIQIPEEGTGRGETVIGSKPYVYELKKTSGQEGRAEESGTSAGKRRTKKTGKIISLRSKIRIKNLLEKDEKRVFIQDGTETKSTVKKSARWIRLQRKKRKQTRKLTDIRDILIPYNQIYIQDNRGSGR